MNYKKFLNSYIEKSQSNISKINEKESKLNLEDSLEIATNVGKIEICELLLKKLDMEEDWDIPTIEDMLSKLGYAEKYTSSSVRKYINYHRKIHLHIDILNKCFCKYKTLKLSEYEALSSSVSVYPKAGCLDPLKEPEISVTEIITLLEAKLCVQLLELLL